MRDRSIRSLFSFFLAALLLFGVLFTPVVALAGAADPDTQSATQFLQSHVSEQFEAGVDNNGYEHDGVNFPVGYFVPAQPFQGWLFGMRSNDSE